MSQSYSHFAHMLHLIGHGSSVNVSGRVEAGHIQNSSTVVVLPANEAATVKSKRVTKSAKRAINLVFL